MKWLCSVSVGFGVLGSVVGAGPPALTMLGAWGHLWRQGIVPSALQVSWGILQEVENVTAPWGCQWFLSGGKGKVLSSRAAWEMGPVGVCCRLLCPRSVRGYLEGSWEGKKPWCVRVVVQSGELAGGRAV